MQTIQTRKSLSSEARAAAKFRFDDHEGEGGGDERSKHPIPETSFGNTTGCKRKISKKVQQSDHSG